MELNPFEDILKEILRKERNKFLALFNKEGLKCLEDLLDTDFGIRGRIERGKQPREYRPFIGWYKDGTLYFCLLTRKNTGKKLDLTLCRKTKKNCGWIENTSYAFRDRNIGFVVYSVKDLVIEGKFNICGTCKNLEEIEKFKVI